jgi:hypothetical protein
MRIVYSVSALLLVIFACASTHADDSVLLSSGGSIHYSTENSKTRLDIRIPTGMRYALSVARDSTVSPKAKPTGVKVVGEIKGSVIILVDTYPSVPGGMSYCQAGEERFLRIISISTKRPKETFRVKLESCRDNLELASPGIEWVPESSTLHIHWLLGPAGKGTPEERTILIGPDGRPA